MSFFEDLFRLLADWLSTWPEWLQWAVILVVGPVMVVHFLLWVMWHLGWLDEDEDEDTNVIPTSGDHP
jgi:hypothetical protein